MQPVNGLYRRVRRKASNVVLARLPGPIRARLLGPEYGFSRSDAQPLAHAEDAPIRCLIAPANFGSQGYYWAQAANLLDGVYCVNLQFVADGQRVVGPASYSVNHRVGKYSRQWARKQRNVLAEEFTHVLLEASTPLLGGLHGAALEKEVLALTRRGIKVGLISHGSEVRLPSRHRELEPSSPFFEPMNGRTQTLETRAKGNIAVLDRLAMPEFVSTPDLLEFRPNATWLPLLTDAAKWITLSPSQLGDRLPVVLHVPSSRPALKGSKPIHDALVALQEEGVIEYLEVNGVPYESMPSYVERADIVVNQVGIGAYGTLALESMIAGRAVVTQVWPSVREYILDQTGMKLPIIEANARSVYSVVREIARNPTAYSSVGGDSRIYANKVHNMEVVAGRLAPFLLS